MDKYEIVKRIEDFAPLETQESWDLSGWIVDREDSEVNRVLFCLTITENVIQQAIKKNCDLIISHHPLFTVPVKYSRINMYCAHTNFDKADGGTTDLLIRKLGFTAKKYGEFVRIVELDQEMSLEYIKLKLLSISSKLRYVNNLGQKIIKTIGFCAGSGSEFINSTPCDVFVTGDLKFHTAIDANKAVFDIGHFESEIFAVNKLMELAKVGDKGIIADEKTPFI